MKRWVATVSFDASDKFSSKIVENFIACSIARWFLNIEVSALEEKDFLEKRDIQSRLGSFEKGWNAPGMEAYDKI